LTIFDFLNYDAFLSVWYWALVILIWTVISHHTIGVPFDLVQRAARLGGQHAEDCDELAMIHARRIVGAVGTAGPLIAGAAMFLLTVLATLGFWLGQEMARAVFMILAPASLAAALGARLAGTVLNQALQGEDLRNALARRRRWDQVIGAVRRLRSAP
jgi:hypothetical protein